MPLPPPDLTRVLREGAELGTEELRGTTSLHDLGVLRVPSGRLVMDDPLVDPAPPFMIPVTPGEHRVSLLVVSVQDAAGGPPDERAAIAVALVDGATVEQVAAEGTVVEAVIPDDEDDPDDLGPDDFFGYGCDSGTGCFADSDRLMLDATEEQWQDDLLDELDRTARDTWSTASVSDGHVVAFSSGWGDGVYPSWTVRTPDGRLLAVITDFLVTRDLDHSELSVPAE